MNKLITRCVAFLALLLCAGAGISSAFAQTGRISMTFAGQVGSEYKLLLMGRQDGTVKLLWGDGTSETKDLYKDKATAIKSKLVDRTLTIEGDVAVLECSGNNLLKLDVAQMPQLTDLISRKNFSHGARSDEKHRAALPLATRLSCRGARLVTQLADRQHRLYQQ